MIEDGMIRIYNRTDERITKVINGVRITIPAHGSANVSERKGRNMLASFPNHLTEDSEYEKHQFTEEDIAKVDLLDLEACRACLRVMMSGQQPDFDKALLETEEREKINSEQK
ncbi:MAG: hypothetical protein IJS15_06315 [Victivallales bacterium]|nr:hypothetical protein [Victivallales bacterium]